MIDDEELASYTHIRTVGPWVAKDLRDHGVVVDVDELGAGAVGVEGVHHGLHLAVERDDEVVDVGGAHVDGAPRAHVGDARHGPDAGDDEPARAEVVERAELLGVLLHQQRGVLVAVVLVAGVVVGHQVVVEVVVAAHPDVEDAPRQRRRQLGGAAQVLAQGVQRLLEVLDLLVERDATHEVLPRVVQDPRRRRRVVHPVQRRVAARGVRVRRQQRQAQELS